MLIFYGVMAGLMAALRFWGAPMLRLNDGGIAIIDFGLVLSAAILIDALIRAVFWRAYFRTRHGHEAPTLLRDLATVVIFALALSLWLYIDLDFSAAGIFAASGATAVVIGLALQGMILDLFSGLSINLDRSYVIGDWLTIHSQDLPEPVYGKVEGISWRCTVLRLEDGRCVLLPNRLVTANPVTNHSRPSVPKRLSVNVTLDVRVPAERALRILLGEAFKAAEANGFHLNPPPSVLLRKVDGDMSCYEVRFFADPEKIGPHEACANMLTGLHGALMRAGLPTPVQQVELSPEPRLGEETPRDSIARVSLFAQTLKAEQLDMLSAAAEPVSFEQGAVIMTQGTQDNSMFVILEGAARVRASLPDAAVVREIAIIASGDIVGEMSLMTGAPRSATVTAMTALRTLKITKPTIEMLLADTPELLDRFSAILAARQAGLTAQADRPESWDFVQRDLLARMRTFFARAFSGSDKKVV